MVDGATYRVAVVQHPPVFLNLGASLQRAEQLVEEAAQGGARLVVFPETWLPGYPVWLDFSPAAALWDAPGAKALFRILANNAIDLERGDALGRLLALAGRTGVSLVMGAHERRGGTLYNIMVFCQGDGVTFGIHRKLMPTYTERLIWGAGDGSTLPVLDTEIGPLGGLICWEHWMPLARAAMHAKGEILHVAQWPMVKELHQIASRHYAFEGQCFVLAAGTVLRKRDVLSGVRTLTDMDPDAWALLESMPGNSDDFIHRGGSAVIAPDASYLAGPLFDDAAVLFADLDPKRIVEGHLTMDTAGHYARPDIFSLMVDDCPKPLVSFRSELEREGSTCW